jgi:hypothetical protein
MLVADCALRDALHTKHYFDVAGHSSRADVLAPNVPAPALLLDGGS